MVLHLFDNIAATNISLLWSWKKFLNGNPTNISLLWSWKK
jgi:hypothetical protein